MTAALIEKIDSLLDERERQPVNTSKALAEIAAALEQVQGETGLEPDGRDGSGGYHGRAVYDIAVDEQEGAVTLALSDGQVLYLTLTVSTRP